MKHRNERPPQGWPALFENWKVGDSLPVVGHRDYVAWSIFAYGMEIGQFRIEPISSTLTRVTRTS